MPAGPPVRERELPAQIGPLYPREITGGGFTTVATGPDAALRHPVSLAILTV